MRVLTLDTETTGLDASVDRIIELAAIESCDDVDVAHWATLVASGRAVPPAVERLTGLTDALVRHGVDERAAVATLAGMIARVDVVLAWNVRFDEAFVRAAAARSDVALPSTPWVCALEATRQRRPDLKGFRLALVARDLGLPTGRSHRALDDARCALSIWRHIDGAGLLRSAASPASSSEPSSEPSSAEPSSAEPSSPEPGRGGRLALFR